MTIRRLVALLTGVLLLAGLSGPAHALASALDPGGVSGRLVAPDGSPQAGGLVRLMDMSTGSTEVSTTSAPDGTFSFSGAQRPARFVIQICQDLADDPCLFPPQNLHFVKLYVGPDDREPSLPALTTYFETDDSAPAVALGDIQLTKPGVVVVKVTNGLEFSYQRLVAVSSVMRPYTRSRLVYRGMAPGRHLVEAFGQRTYVTVGPGERVGTVISKRQPAVAGRVVVNGRPVRNAPVTLTGADDTSPTGVVRTTRTGTDGRYSFTGLPLSSTPWRLRIGAALLTGGNHTLVTGTPHRLAEFRLAAGQTRTVNLITPSGQRGAVRVTFSQEPDGTTDRRAALLTTQGELVGNLPLRQQRPAVAGLAPGTYIVAMHWVTSSGNDRTDWKHVQVRAGHTAQVTLSPRKGPGQVTVTAPPGAQVFATALFPGDASSSLREYAAAERTKTVPASGKVVFGALPTGRYRVYLSPNDDRPDETVTRLVGEGNTTVDLSTPTPEASIRGQLVNPATGQPWPWTRVIADTLDCNGDHDGGSERIEDGGYIVVDELHTGTYWCELVGFWADRGTPYAGPNGFFVPVTGTYPVTSGAQLDRDFLVPFVPAGG
ncbi:Carboxypeptidase regulatory-like domain-containing protein [Nocardioides szechwanensis]|uniref:Carboxypeptidase regulatory-like domain-containing protein n=1 Tax=Nocardioides szechwanensis TaxID=1005944 RepID=A0A1H0FDA8_9ACTN